MKLFAEGKKPHLTALEEVSCACSTSCTASLRHLIFILSLALPRGSGQEAETTSPMRTRSKMLLP